MKIMSCDMIASNFLNINGRIDTNEKIITFCCEPIESKPAMGFKDTPEETLHGFVGMHTMSIIENNSDNTERYITAGCLKCANFQMKDYNVHLPIGYVNLSMYPAPCQCRCIYCNVYKKYDDTPEVRTAYEKLFDMLEYGINSGAIDPNARWQVSTGEITIHPYHDRIMKFINNRNATFYTNAFIYDEAIANNLHKNPASAINLSIDSGTAETWEKIKGFNNFEKVMMNLVMYSKASTHPGQISLKYIILPDINDTYEDYKNLMEIMKILKVPHLTLSRDTRKKYNANSDELTKLMGAAAYLLAFCSKNDFSVDMFSFKPEEQKTVISQAKEILAKELI